MASESTPRINLKAHNLQSSLPTHKSQSGYQTFGKSKETKPSQFKGQTGESESSARYDERGRLIWPVKGDDSGKPITLERSDPDLFRGANQEETKVDEVY